MKWSTTLLMAMLVLGLAALSLTVPNADAQTETNLYSFGSLRTIGPRGQSPYAGLIQGSEW